MRCCATASAQSSARLQLSLGLRSSRAAVQDPTGWAILGGRIAVGVESRAALGTCAHPMGWLSPDGLSPHGTGVGSLRASWGWGWGSLGVRSAVSALPRG